MKLVIFTPVVKTSAIARMVSLVTRNLMAAGHNVAIVRTENENYLGATPYDFGSKLFFWNDFEQVKFLCDTADALIYQIGDNYEFHGGCLEWLPRLPGIVCLHDFFLGHLFWAWAETRRQQADLTLQAWYNKEVARHFFRHPNSEAFIASTYNTAPMTEWICSMAYGVVTHSNWDVTRVMQSCPGPVYVVPLAYELSELKNNLCQKSYSTNDLFRILTIGHVNNNKRIASVIRAIGNSHLLREHSSYRLIGKISPEIAQMLSVLARNYQVNLIISGEVERDILTEALMQTDVISCLRWPSLEAASASAIEAMLAGKPTIVTDTGFYSELPDSCVKKIDPCNEINSLQTALELLYNEPQLRANMGIAAQKWAMETFTAENYAQQLIKMSLSVSQVKPVLNAVSYFANIMRDWGASDKLMNLSNHSALMPMGTTCSH